MCIIAGELAFLCNRRRHRYNHPIAAGRVKMAWLGPRMSSLLLQWIQGAVDRYNHIFATELK